MGWQWPDRDTALYKWRTEFSHGVTSGIDVAQQHWAPCALSLVHASVENPNFPALTAFAADGTSKPLRHGGDGDSPCG